MEEVIIWQECLASRVYRVVPRITKASTCVSTTSNNSVDGSPICSILMRRLSELDSLNCVIQIRSPRRCSPECLAKTRVGEKERRDRRAYKRSAKLQPVSMVGESEQTRRLLAFLSLSTIALRQWKIPRAP